MVSTYYNNYHDTTNFSDTSPRMTLTSGVEVTYTVPGSDTHNYQAIFGYAANTTVLVGCNTTVTLPSSNTVDSTGSAEVNPIKRFVKGGDVLHFITPDTSALVGVSLRRIPS